MDVLWWISLAFIMLVWGAYPLFVGIMSKLVGNKNKPENELFQKLSVVIAAHNEARNLPTRIENIYRGSYPAELIEVIIASDGSTDETKDLVNELRQHYPRIKLVEINPQGGRSNAHNQAVSHCQGEILVFTDAETQFAVDFLEKITAPFISEEVGFTSGVLKYRNQNSCAITESAGFYWRFEYFLRTCESALGLYAFGSGACCAVRKNLYRNIPAAGDVDFTTPLDVVLQNRKCIHVSDAIAYDEMPESPQREFRARVRMTSKNLYGTIERWGWKAFFRHPLYSLVIGFHKVGRWLTPFGMIALLFSNLFLLGGEVFYAVMLGAQVSFYLLALAGYRGIDLPLSKQAYSFCLANAGFLIGVLKALTRRVPKLYQPISQT